MKGPQQYRSHPTSILSQQREAQGGTETNQPPVSFTSHIHPLTAERSTGRDRDEPTSGVIHIPHPSSHSREKHREGPRRTNLRCRSHPTSVVSQQREAQGGTETNQPPVSFHSHICRLTAERSTGRGRDKPTSGVVPFPHLSSHSREKHREGPRQTNLRCRSIPTSVLSQQREAQGGTETNQPPVSFTSHIHPLTAERSTGRDRDEPTSGVIHIPHPSSHSREKHREGPRRTNLRCHSHPTSILSQQREAQGGTETNQPPVSFHSHICRLTAERSTGRDRDKPTSSVVPFPHLSSHSREKHREGPRRTNLRCRSIPTSVVSQQREAQGGTETNQPPVSFHSHICPLTAERSTGRDRDEPTSGVVPFPHLSSHSREKHR